MISKERKGYTTNQKWLVTKIMNYNVHWFVFNEHGSHLEYKNIMEGVCYLARSVRHVSKSHFKLVVIKV